MSVFIFNRNFAACLMMIGAGSIVIGSGAVAGKIDYPVSFADGEILTASDLNANLNEIETVVNGNATGIEFDSSLEDDIPLVTDNAVIQSVEVSAPGPGFVLVSFSATYRIRHRTNISDIIEIGISDSNSGNVVINSLPSRRFIFLDSGYSSGNMYGSVATSHVYEVVVGGDYSFYVLGRSNKPNVPNLSADPPDLPSDSFSVSRPTIQAIFVPNRY